MRRLDDLDAGLVVGASAAAALVLCGLTPWAALAGAIAFAGARMLR